MLTMYQQITIKTLVKQGEQKIRIAEQLGCHRNTVRNVLNRKQPMEKQTRNKPSCFDGYLDQIKTWLDQKVTRRRIHELLAQEYRMEKSYDNLCKYIQKQFPKQLTAYGVQTTAPGEEAEVDFGYLGMLPGPEGRLVKTWGLAVILGFSRLGYWAVAYDQKLDTLVKCLTLAFESFGGVPERLKVDNMKTAILKNLHYQLEYNQDFLEFAHHYGTVIIPCTPCHPEQKGKVEAGIKYLKNNFLNGRRFQDHHDLTKQLKGWMTNYANSRIHGTTKKIPRQVWELEEKQSLQSLPEEEFAFFQRGVRLVAANCHIQFENNYYSVPGRLVGKEVTVRYNRSLVRIIYQGDQVGLHRLSSGQGEYVTVRAHLPDYKSYSQTEYQARWEEKMAEIGRQTHQYFQRLLIVKDSYWGRTARGILGLAREYGPEAVELSLARALHYQVTDLTAIRNILVNRLYRLEPEPKLPIGLTGVNTEDSLARSPSYYALE